VAVKSKLVFPFGKQLSGKASERAWKAIRKAKTRKELKSVLWSLMNIVQEIEQNVDEIRRFVGSKTKY
jgi:hypothetical protein